MYGVASTVTVTPDVALPAAIEIVLPVVWILLKKLVKGEIRPFNEPARSNPFDVLAKELLDALGVTGPVA